MSFFKNSLETVRDEEAKRRRTGGERKQERRKTRKNNDEEKKREDMTSLLGALQENLSAINVNKRPSIRMMYTDEHTFGQPQISNCAPFEMQHINVKCRVLFDYRRPQHPTHTPDLNIPDRAACNNIYITQIHRSWHWNLEKWASHTSKRNSPRGDKLMDCRAFNHFMIALVIPNGGWLLSNDDQRILLFVFFH